jgi:hypothetical protein
MSTVLLLVQLKLKNMKHEFKPRKLIFGPNFLSITVEVFEVMIL